MGGQFPAILVENRSPRCFRRNSEIRNRNTAHGIVRQLKVKSEGITMTHCIRVRPQKRGDTFRSSFEKRHRSDGCAACLSDLESRLILVTDYLSGFSIQQYLKDADGINGLQESRR